MSREFTNLLLRQMNKWSRQPQGRVKHETQEIYDILTNNHRGYGLDVNRWVKFLKECPKVINKDFEPSAAELLFTKVCGVGHALFSSRLRVAMLKLPNPITARCTGPRARRKEDQL